MSKGSDVSPQHLRSVDYPKDILARTSFLESLSWYIRILICCFLWLCNWEAAVGVQPVSSSGAAILFCHLNHCYSHLFLHNLFLLYLTKRPIWHGMEIKLKGKMVASSSPQIVWQSTCLKQCHPAELSATMEMLSSCTSPTANTEHCGYGSCKWGPQYPILLLKIC